MWKETQRQEAAVKEMIIRETVDYDITDGTHPVRYDIRTKLGMTIGISFDDLEYPRPEFREKAKQRLLTLMKCSGVKEEDLTDERPYHGGEIIDV